LLAQQLDAQLAEEEARKVAAYEQFMKDKSMIDEIVQRIHAEDASAAHDEAERKLSNRRDMDEFEQQQAEYRLQTEQKLAAEDATLRRQVGDAACPSSCCFFACGQSSTGVDSFPSCEFDPVRLDVAVAQHLATESGCGVLQER
jgi:hypothetical protein